MAHSERPAAGMDLLAFLVGGGEMGERIRAFDWSKTPLGSVESWSPALRTVVRLLLANRLPMLLWWGPQYISIYNDPYRPVLGNKHPWGLGLPVMECWQEIWHILKPLIDTPFHGGPATWDEDILLVINRYGFNEETHWLIAYSPVPDENAPSGIGGVLATVHETTEKVLSERRMRALRDLGSRPAEAKTPEAACVVAAHTLETHSEDIPFALLYLTDADGRHARLVATAGVATGQDISRQLVDLDVSDGAWPLAEVKRTMQPQVVADLGARFSSVPSGPWPDPPTTAVVQAIGSSKPHESAGFLVAGVSSRLRLDDAYLDFLGLVTTQIATAIANARAYEEEKRRTESLAELDRAKTIFFLNVSHEFRTPLTLILGPLDDAISDTRERGQRDRLLTLQRNALRLQKLVNTLLDFSRIEARRVQVSFQPVDLSAFTRELASNFQSACEKAGLGLVVDCAPLPEPVYVDAEMWEKIVLNLVSNAFKFTLKGRIEITLRQLGRHAELVVRDTGVGIPADQMPRLFERFHRVEGVTGRSQEGSGIGLALVRELVRLHGGEVSAESVVGKGTSFVVKIPFGTAHLQGKLIVPATALNSTALQAGHYVEEALRWLPDANPAEGEAPTSIGTLEPESGAGLQFSGERPRILLADDNADMRQYLHRILCEHYHVEAVSDGQAALDAVKRSMPDLILTDVMMPRLDGFGLLREVRADPLWAGVPVIMLSARAGEESRVEGMQAGADDYLVKPFSAKELLARVGSLLQITRLRRESEQAIRQSEERFRALVRASSDVVFRMSADWTEMRFLQGREFITDTHEPSRTWLQKYLHPDDRPQVMKAIGEAIRTKSVFESEHRVVRLDGTVGWAFSRAVPLLGTDGEIVEWFGAVSDVTERRRLEKENADRLRAARQLAAIVESSEDAIVSKSLDGIIQTWNATAERLFGFTAEQAVGQHISLIIPADRAKEEEEIIARIRAGESVEHFDTVRVRSDGQHIPISLTISPIRDETGRIVGASKIARDVTDRKQAEERIYSLMAELKQADKRKDEFLATLAHELRNPLAPIRNALELMRQAKDDKELIEDARRTMERQMTQMVRLVDDLMDVNRINQNKLQLRKQRIDLAAVVQSAVETSRPLIEQGGHQLTLMLPQEAIPLDGDLTRLAQVFANLLTNAAKYTEQGGRIWLTAERVGSNAIVKVRDTGIGIPAEAMPTLFEMFSQVDRSLERSQGGLGIGLMLVKRLTEMHGGTIEAHSEGTSKGSEFTVSLPIVTEKSKPPKSEAEKVITVSGRRILVVDDLKDSAQSLAILLNLLGNKVRTAYDGEEAVRAAEEYRPEVILLDIGLPKLNGYEAARRIRERLGNNVLMIALSGWGGEEDRRRAREAGFNAHMTKPIELDTLQKLLLGSLP